MSLIIHPVVLVFTLDLLITLLILYVQGIMLPGIRKWPGAAFSFHIWMCLNPEIDLTEHNIGPTQSYRRVLYRWVWKICAFGLYCHCHSAHFEFYDKE